MNNATDDDLAKRLVRIERDWQSMQRIRHDFFHGWRQAVQDRYGVEAAKFWSWISTDALVKEAAKCFSIAEASRRSWKSSCIRWYVPAKSWV